MELHADFEISGPNTSNGWHFGLTWHHRSRYHLIPRRSFHICFAFLDNFYPRDAMLAREIAIVTCLSVCPTVRPSVRLSVRHAPVLCQNEKASVMIFSPPGSPMILVFWCQILSGHSKGFPGAGASNKGGVGKISGFLSLRLNISKTVADTVTNRIWAFHWHQDRLAWMTLNSISLDELEFSSNFARFRTFRRQQRLN